MCQYRGGDLYQGTAWHTAAGEPPAAEEDIHLELDTADTSDLKDRHPKESQTDQTIKTLTTGLKNKFSGSLKIFNAV